MPIATDPNSRLRVVLECDKGKSPEPAFFVRPSTLRVWRKSVEIEQSRHKAETPDQALNYLLEGIRLGLIGWENMIDEDGKPIEYATENLDLVIGLEDAHELLSYVQSAGLLLIQDKKKSESLPSCSTESSAEAVSQENASTAQPNASP